MIGIELFAGAGGMAEGAKACGIKTKIAIESDYYAAQTYLKNHKETTVIVDKVENVTHFDFERNEELVLFGGPPCQGYSKSNRKTNTRHNPKNWLFKEFIKITKTFQPEWIVIENVPGLEKMDKGYFLKAICYELNTIGYTPNLQILNAYDFGVPQNRERLFIVASRRGIAFDFPCKNMNNTKVTVREALQDLPILKNGAKDNIKKYRKNAQSSFAKKLRRRKKVVTGNLVTKNSELILRRYSHIRQGKNWKDIPIELMNNYKDHTRCHGNIYRRLKLDMPSPIISNYRKSMLIHPTQHRGLSVREAARIQSFPDSYEFSGSLDQQQQQVGNAVPPILAQTIFQQIIKAN